MINPQDLRAQASSMGNVDYADALRACQRAEIDQRIYICQQQNFGALFANFSRNFYRVEHLERQAIYAQSTYYRERQYHALQRIEWQSERKELLRTMGVLRQEFGSRDALFSQFLKGKLAVIAMMFFIYIFFMSWHSFWLVQTGQLEREF